MPTTLALGHPYILESPGTFKISHVHYCISKQLKKSLEGSTQASVVVHVSWGCQWAAKLQTPHSVSLLRGFVENKVDVGTVGYTVRCPGHNVAFESKGGNLTIVGVSIKTFLVPSRNDSSLVWGQSRLKLAPVPPLLKGVRAVRCLRDLMTQSAADLSLLESNCGKPRPQRWKSAWVTAF